MFCTKIDNMGKIVFQSNQIFNVLIIEDNLTVQKAIQIQLEKSSVWKFDFITVDNMTDAIKIKNTQEFHIVLADLILPDSDRKSTLSILRNEFSDLPFVILTSTDDDQLLIESLQAGAQNYLCKEYMQFGALLSRTLYNAIQRWEMESKLKYMASHDDLTGAMNKRFFMIELQRRIDQCEATDDIFSLAICDLDNFRQVNNSHGHVVGDRALKIFVEKIQSVIRNQDIIARFGGDEFCILFPGTPKERCEKFLKKLTSLTIEIPFENKSLGSIFLKSSYGGSQYRKGMNAEQLLIAADNTLYEVKNSGKGFSKVI